MSIHQSSHESCIGERSVRPESVVSKRPKQDAIHQCFQQLVLAPEATQYVPSGPEPILVGSDPLELPV